VPHQHDIEIESVVPGPEIIVLEGVVDGCLVNVDLNTRPVLALFGITLAEFREQVWGHGLDAGLAMFLYAALEHYYHVAAAAGGAWRSS
jgi:hypothetical protein